MFLRLWFIFKMGKMNKSKLSRLTCLYTFNFCNYRNRMLLNIVICDWFLLLRIQFLRTFHAYTSSNTLAIWCEEPTHWKRRWCWERLRAREEGTTEVEMVGWHHWLNGYEFEQTLGESEGQGSLVCCSSWNHQESRAQLSDWATTALPFCYFLLSESNPKYIQYNI